jgi:hypothetical protein
MRRDEIARIAKFVGRSRLVTIYAALLSGRRSTDF